MKKAIAGHGLARKEQVQEMVRRLLKLPAAPGKDAADALGIAICHAHAGSSFAAMAKAGALTSARRTRSSRAGGLTRLLSARARAHRSPNGPRLLRHFCYMTTQFSPLVGSTSFKPEQSP